MFRTSVLFALFSATIALHGQQAPAPSSKNCRPIKPSQQ